VANLILPFSIELVVGMRKSIVLCATFAVIYASADEVIYADNALSSSWQDWSWGSTITYNAKHVKEGSSSISVDSTGNSALSLRGTSVISNFAGLRFDLAVRAP
jgi:hypothetical protein